MWAPKLITVQDGQLCPSCSQGSSSHDHNSTWITFHMKIVGGMTPGRVTQEKHSVRAKWAELGPGRMRLGRAGRSAAGLA